MAANLTQTLNFKANFHKEFELFSNNKMYAEKKKKKNIRPWVGTNHQPFG